MANSSYISDLDYDEFQNIIEIGKGKNSVIRRADWTKHNNRIALKNLNSKEEFIQEIKQLCKVNYHPNINHLLGTTKDTFGNDIMVLEYANEGSLRDYLKNQFSTLNWSQKIEMALDVTRGLMCLHSENIIHRSLHAENVLVNDGKLKISDLAHSAQQFEDLTLSKVHVMVEYADPKYLFDPVNYKLSMKSDIYSLSILLWELSSGRPPYSKVQKSHNKLRHDILNGLREIPVENTPIKYQQLYQKCWKESLNQRSNIFEVFEVLSQLKFENIGEAIVENVDDVEDESTDQEIIQKLKLNHGLFLNDYTVQPSEQAIYDDNGELDVDLYDEPLVYTDINLSFDDNFDNNFETSFQPYDACINFPFAKVSFNGDLLGTFLNYENTDGKLNDYYGHFFSKKVLVGGQLFIKDLNTATTTQIHLLKMHLNWAYNLVKREDQNQLYNINVQLEPTIETLDGKEITTTEELVNWMKNLYQENMIDVISYINPIPILKLKDDPQLVDNIQGFDEKIIKVANYKDRLNFGEWVKDSIYVNLPEWIDSFNLFQGLIINKNSEVEIAHKAFIDLIKKYPYLESKDNFHLKFKKPTNELEISSNKLEISSVKKIKSHIFNSVFDDVNGEKLKNYENNICFIINYEQYEIFLPRDNITLSKGFRQDIGNAIKDMRPREALQDVFNKYGYLFPQKIVLGKSFNYISTRFSPKFDRVSSKISTIESLKSYLKHLEMPDLTQKEKIEIEIPYLLTKEEKIEIDELPDFIQENKDDLEIIEYDNIINLYDMLQYEQQKQIDIIFDEGYKVIMVGRNDLKDLNDDNTENYKYISINLSLKDQDYEVFGSIVSDDILEKSGEFSVKFKFYDFKGFTAIIKNLEDLKNRHLKITKCYILWVIVGKPSKLSVFSPKNRICQIDCINESILLQPDKSYYEIKTPFQLSQGCVISINTYHPPINNEPADLIKFVKWSHNSIIFHSNPILRALNVNENNYIDYEVDVLVENFSIELHICIFTDFKKLKIDNEENEFSLNLIGNILTKENFIIDKYNDANEFNINESNINENNINYDNLNNIVNQIIDFLINEKYFTFDESKRIQ
ncbi:unnamed protein product [Rhizophagus irregularis]|nr:unnamed protein product [Rhizophagus irregularis]